MKRFLIRVFWDVCLVGLGIICLNSALRRNISERSVYTDRKNYFENIPDDIVVANVGNSHGFYGLKYDLVLDGLYGNCANFALPSQTLVYDYNMLDFYRHKLRDNAVVFIPISYFSLYCEEFTPDFESQNNRYYEILDYGHIERVDLQKYFQVKCLPFGFWAEDLTGNMFYPNMVVEQPPEAGVTRTLEEIAEIIALSHNNIVIREGGHARKTELEIDSLYKIFELCRKENWIPILLTMPYTQEYNTNVPEDLLEDYYRDMEFISKQQGVLWWDFSGLEDFTKHPELFQDSDHMNQEGAFKFTDMIIQKLYEENLLEDMI